MENWIPTLNAIFLFVLPAMSHTSVRESSFPDFLRYILMIFRMNDFERSWATDFVLVLRYGMVFSVFGRIDANRWSWNMGMMFIMNHWNTMYLLYCDCDSAVQTYSLFMEVNELSIVRFKNFGSRSKVVSPVIF